MYYLVYLFSFYFYKKQLQIETSVDAHEDLLSQSSFETRMTRILLVTNSFMKDDIGARLCELYFQHNDNEYVLTRELNKTTSINQDEFSLRQNGDFLNEDEKKYYEMK